jgi:hypothetical protein
MTDNVYFVRHKMHIPCEDAKELFKKRLIAFHYEDIRSWDPNEYSTMASKKTIKHFEKLDKDGDWVIADYSPILCTDKDRNIAKENNRETILVGEVEKNSRDYYESTGLCTKEKAKEHKKYHLKDKHIYKTLRLEKYKELSVLSYTLFQLPFPRGTISPLRMISVENVQNMYNGDKLDNKAKSLAPSQLEVLCEEYLRVENRKMKDLPRLKMLLAPIGGSMKDIDIAGLDSNGHYIFAQVSQAKDKRVEEEKIERLRRIGDKESSLIYFGPKDTRQKSRYKEEGIRYVDIDEVFKESRSHRELKSLIKLFLSPSKSESRQGEEASI